MGLIFTGADTDKVEVGTSATLDNEAGTILVWANPTSLPNAALRLLFAKGASGELWFNTSGGANQLVIQRARATAASVAAADWTNVPVATANAWNFWGAQWNTAGGNTDQKLFGGSLTAQATEVTTYATQSVGSGTPVSLTGTTGVIGNLASGSNSFPANIAFIGIWNRQLSLDEIRGQQFNPQPTTGCVLFHHLGITGTGTQTDGSGAGNDGTVTGATVGDHVPLGLGLYGDAYNVTNTSTTTYVDCGEIPASSFTANAKYLLVSNIYFEGTSAANDVNVRWVHGTDGAETLFTDGDWSRDVQGGSNGINFGGIAVFTQPGTAEQVKLQIKMEATGTATSNLGQIFALNLSSFFENQDYYFNEHTTDDATMSTTYEDGASITIVGNGVDTWWVCGDIVRNTGATTVLDRSRLNLDANTDHTYLNEGDDTTDKNSWLFSRSFVPDSSSVCTMQYSVASGTTGTYFSSRIFAINLTKFRQFFAEDTTADSGSIQTNFVTLATESVTPEVTGDWFYIGGFCHNVTGAGTDTLNVRLQDDNTGSLVSNPGYGDDEPGIYAGDPLDEDGLIIFYQRWLSAGASRTINVDARDTATASTAKNRTLVGFALQGAPPAFPTGYRYEWIVTQNTLSTM